MLFLIQQSLKVDFVLYTTSTHPLSPPTAFLANYILTNCLTNFVFVYVWFHKVVFYEHVFSHKYVCVNISLYTKISFSTEYYDFKIHLWSLCRSHHSISNFIVQTPCVLHTETSWIGCGGMSIGDIIWNNSGKQSLCQQKECSVRRWSWVQILALPLTNLCDLRELFTFSELQCLLRTEVTLPVMLWRFNKII